MENLNSRAYCSWFGFKGADQQKKVEALSSGERNRCQLAKVVKSGANVLLLDEPTNDLDVETIRSLDEAILELKENEFKDIFKEELLEKEFVQDCTLETDFSLVIPDDYVNEIEERLSLYKKLDQHKSSEEISKYNEELKDRFGAIPNQTKELIKTIRLRN